MSNFKVKTENYGWFLVLVVFVGILTSMVIYAADTDPVATADDLYAKRADATNVRQAITVLEQAINHKPDQYEALWRLARCYFFLGDQAKGKDRLTLFEKGKIYAEKAVESNPDGFDGHYYLALTIGAYGEERGILNSLFMVGPMKKELEICLQKNPKYPEAHDLLALLYWKAPGPPLSIGNKKKALEEVKLATMYGPYRINFWLHLGQIAIANKENDLARKALEKALALPDDPEDPVASAKDKAEATKELKALK